MNDAGNTLEINDTGTWTILLPILFYFLAKLSTIPSGISVSLEPSLKCLTLRR